MFYRMFAVTRCGRCRAGISANELVMRARDLVYHLHCFTCGSCGVPLSTGDHFGMRDGLVYCRPHYELLDYCDSVEQLVYHRPPSPGYYTSGASPGGCGTTHKGRPRKRKLPNGRDSPLRMSTPSALGKILFKNKSIKYFTTTNQYFRQCMSN